MGKRIRSAPRAVFLLALVCGGAFIPEPTIGQVAGILGQAAQERLKERERLWAEAQRLLAQGQRDQAIAFAEKVLAIEREVLGAEHHDVAGALRWLAGAHVSRDDFVAARKALQEGLAIEMKVHGEKHWHVTDVRWELATYERVAVMEPDQRRRLGEASQLDRQSNELNIRGKYGEAISVAQKSLAITSQLLGEEDPDTATRLSNLALLYYNMGAYDRAESLILKALEVRRKTLGEGHPRYAISLDILARIYYQVSEYDRAEPLFRQALDVRRKTLGEGHPVYASSLCNLATLYRAMGTYDRAEPLLRQALEITRRAQGEGHHDYAHILNSLAGLYRALGAYERAEPLYRQALEIRRKTLGEKHPEYATSLHNLAVLYGDMGAFDRALPLCRQALEIRRKALGEKHPDYANSLDNLAVLYSVARGANDQAEPLLRQALEIMRTTLGEGHPDYANSLDNLAALYADMGEYDRAEPLFRQSLEIRRTTLGEQHPDYAINLTGLAKLYQITNRPQQALITLDRVLEIEQLNLSRIFTFSAEPAMLAYLRTVSNTPEMLLTMAASRGAADPSVIETALTWTLRRKAVILETLCRFREAQRQMDRDPDVARSVVRLRGLRQRLTNLILNPPTGMDPTALQRYRADLRDQADRLEADLNRLLVAQRPEMADDPEKVDSAAVRRHLPAGAALVELVRFRPFDFQAKGKATRWKPARYIALVLTAEAGAPPRLIDLGEADPIDQAILELRKEVERVPRGLRAGQTEQELEASFRAASSELYILVFAPLRAALDSATLVYLDPDGELNRLPFEALVDDQGRYLIESYRFAYLPSGRDLLRSHPQPGRGTVVFASPDYDLGVTRRQQAAQTLLAALPQGPALALRGALSRDLRGASQWKPLSGTVGELTLIRQTLQDSRYGPVQAYTGPQALEEVFKALRSPRLLHVATHGFFLEDRTLRPEDRDGLVMPGPGYGAARGLVRLRGVENPLLRSGLVLAGANTLGEPPQDPGAVDDGWVTAEEIASMDLHGTELVVLSACESGLGDVRTGEGVYGLRRAFLHAGAQTLVISLFKVPDEQTRQLMGDFYGALRAGRGRLEALHGARMELLRRRRAEGGVAHPFFWASFVLVGDPQ